jgi:predicted nucleic acid-binding protein
VSFVLDASVTMAWILPDAGTGAITSLFEAFLREGGVVPSLWKLEVANTLLAAERHGRIDEGFRRAAINDLAALPIPLDTETLTYAWRTTLDLAAYHRLSLYDAAYLELAIRLAIPLATFDRELIRAAKAAQVRLILE